MRQSTWVNAALVALALGTFGVVWATREAPSTGELLARKGKLLPFFRKDAVSRIVLTRDGRDIELSSDSSPDRPGEFRIVRPGSERADTASVNQLLDTLDTASTLRSADDVAPEAAGLTEKSPRIRVQIGKETALLRLGGPAPTPAGAHFIEVTTDAAPKRYVVSASVNDDLDLPLSKLRDPRLFDYALSELKGLTASRGLPITRGDHGLFFQVVLPPQHGTTSPARELANPAALHVVFDALSRLTADPLIDLDEAQKYLGSDPAKLTLTPTDSKQGQVTLSIVGRDGRFIVLAEQQDRAPRAGYVPADVGAHLLFGYDSMWFDGLVAARMDEVEELRVSRGSEKLVLSRKDKAFILKAPHAGDVALDAGNERITSIIALSGTRPETSDLAELGLAKPDGELTVQVTGENSIERHEQTVTLGSVRRDGSLCAERQLDHVRLCFPADAAKALAPDASLLKALALNEFAPSDLSWLETQTTSLKQTVQRSEDGSFDLIEPKGYARDGALVTDAVQALGTLQAVRWVASAAEPRFGFASPELRVRFELKNPTGAHELVIGAATGGGHFARLEPDPAVFLVSDQAFDALSSPFIDRALSPEASAQSSIEVTGLNSLGGVPPHLTVPVSATGDVAETLRSLKAELTVHLGPAKPNEGLSTPTLEITYSAAAPGKAVKIIVGNCDKLRGQSVCYARRNDVNATFALSNSTVSVLRSATHYDP